MFPMLDGMSNLLLDRIDSVALQHPRQKRSNANKALTSSLLLGVQKNALSMKADAIFCLLLRIFVALWCPCSGDRYWQLSLLEEEETVLRIVVAFCWIKSNIYITRPLMQLPRTVCTQAKEFTFSNGIERLVDLIHQWNRQCTSMFLTLLLW